MTSVNPPKTTDPRIFVVVAAYNEARVIASVIRRLKSSFPNIIVVDDGSTDGTANCLRDCGVFVLRHSINRGQGAALQTGIRFALMEGADVIVTFDADGQHDEQDIQALVEPVLRHESDLTLGSRFLGRAQHMPFSRQVVLKLGVLFTRIVSRLRLTDVHNGLRAFSRPVASSLHITMDRMAHASEILDEIKQAGWRYKEVAVNVRYSSYSMAKGQSSWNAIVISTQILLRKLTR